VIFLKLLEFARLVRQGNNVLPENTLLKGHLIWHSVEELQREPYDPTRNSVYLQHLELANQELTRMMEKERRTAEDALEARVEDTRKLLWSMIGTAFCWQNGRTGEQVGFTGKIKWCATQLLSGPTLTGSGMKYLETKCPDEGREIDLKPFVEPWLRDYATRLTRENATPKPARVFKELLRELPVIVLACSKAHPLIHPDLRCSTYTSGSYSVLRCHEIQLQLTPK